jgi:hypothetical protein
MPQIKIRALALVAFSSGSREVHAFFLSLLSPGRIS